MATMISEVYDALRDAQGVSEEKARKAAEAVAAFGNRFTKIETDLTLLKGMVGGLYLMLAPSAWFVVRIAANVGALG
jgi:hypothetical protein